MDAKALEFLEKLSNSIGPSGFERGPIRTMKEYVGPYVDSVKHDRLGNLFFESVGDEKGPKVLVPCHVDEVGFIVMAINKDGYLNFHQLGGWFDQVLLGQRVKVMTKDGLVPGLIACKPPHVMDAEERKKVVTTDKMYIDVGASNREEAEVMGIRIGDAVVPDSKFYVIEKKRIRDGKDEGSRKVVFGKAFDNRISAFMTVELMRRLKEEEIAHPNRVIGVATVQEELGERGARTAANFVDPDVTLVMDVEVAGDVPGIEPQQAPGRMGEGVCITVFDASMIPNQPLKELAITVCEKNRIPYQLTHAAGGGTDGGPISLSNIGCPSVVVSVAVRHIHSHIGAAEVFDMENGLRAFVELVKVLDRKTVESLSAI